MGGQSVQLPDGTEMPPLADGDYDVIVLGTGLKECIISGILSVDGKKVDGTWQSFWIARCIPMGDHHHVPRCMRI
jgi:hypothetical protein